MSRGRDPAFEARGGSEGVHDGPGPVRSRDPEGIEGRRHGRDNRPRARGAQASVEPGDTQCVHFPEGEREQVRGGSAAYLLTFTFREVDTLGVTWLHARLGATRTGTIVAAVSAPLDSLGVTTPDRARAIVDSLAASPGL